MKKSEHALVLVTGLVAWDRLQRHVHSRIQAIDLTIAHWFHLLTRDIYHTREWSGKSLKHTHYAFAWERDGGVRPAL